MPREGGAARRVTSMGVDVQEFAWRPDRQAIAFIANAHQRDEYVYDRADVWITRLDERPLAPRRITDDGYDHDAVAWSPDGTALVLPSADGARPGHRLEAAARCARRPLPIAVDIHAGEAEDASRLARSAVQLQNLTADWDFLPGRPMVSADGRTVFFSAGIGGNEHLFSVAAAGGGGAADHQGDRQLGSFCASRAFDRWVYTATDVQHPGEIYSAGSTFAADEKRLTRSTIA